MSTSQCKESIHHPQSGRNVWYFYRVVPQEILMSFLSVLEHRGWTLEKAMRDPHGLYHVHFFQEEK